MNRPRRLRIPDEIGDRVRSLHPDLKRRIRATIDGLLSDPVQGKPLRGQLLGFNSVRVGRFRVVYRVVQDIVEILTIGPRRTVYEEAARLTVRTRA
ncbi:MAG: type II toxin-antitoxin system RelE family toxin [Gammaproteobacteria bacterium]